MIIVLNYTSNILLPVSACADVTVCLNDPPWKAQTVSGSALVQAKIVNSGRTLARGRTPRDNPRGVGVHQYSLEIDDAQFLPNPATPGVNFQPTCDDIHEVVPYKCLETAIVDLEARVP